MTMKTAALRFCLLALLSAVASSHMMGGHGMMRDEDNMMMGGGEMMMGDCPYAVRVGTFLLRDFSPVASVLCVSDAGPFFPDLSGSWKRYRGWNLY